MTTETQGTSQTTTGAGESQTAGQTATGQQTAGESLKTEGQGGAQDQTKTGEAAKVETVDYDTFEFKHPDGGTLDQGAVAAFRPIAKELGLSAEGSQKLVGLYAGQMLAQQQAYTEAQAQWVNDIKADKDVGGAKFDESMRSAKAAMDRVGDPALKELLDTTGWGNHPVIFKAFAKLGQSFVSDNPMRGGQTPSGDSDTASAFFPTMSK